ncbi:MAG: GNAT family protein [Chloroflexota bacterium]
MRSFQDSDIQTFAAYRSEPDVAKYQSWDAPYPIEQATNLVKAVRATQPGTVGEWYQVALERKEGNELIGDCAFHILADEPQQAEIGYTLASKYQGYGYATEAVTRLLDYLFGELNLHRVRATCDVDNLASSKLLERIGMRREAHFVENIWFKGQWGSEYLYALLRSEWILSSDSASNIFS